MQPNENDAVPAQAHPLMVEMVIRFPGSSDVVPADGDYYDVNIIAEGIDLGPGRRTNKREFIVRVPPGTVFTVVIIAICGGIPSDPVEAVFIATHDEVAPPGKPYIHDRQMVPVGPKDTDAATAPANGPVQVTIGETDVKDGEPK